MAVILSRPQCVKLSRLYTGICGIWQAVTHCTLGDLCGCNLESVIFQTHIKDRYLWHFLWNCSQVNATRPHWWSVNIRSGAVRQQAITWAIVDLLSVKPCGIHVKVNSLEMLKISIVKILFRNYIFKTTTISLRGRWLPLGCLPVRIATTKYSYCVINYC